MLNMVTWKTYTQLMRLLEGGDENDYTRCSGPRMNTKSGLHALIFVRCISLLAYMKSRYCHTAHNQSTQITTVQSAEDTIMSPKAETFETKHFCGFMRVDEQQAKKVQNEKHWSPSPSEHGQVEVKTVSTE